MEEKNLGTVEEDWRIAEEVGEEDLATVKEEGDSITVKKVEEEDLRIVNAEKWIGLKWRHLMTTSMRQTKEEDLILTGEDLIITGEDVVLAEEGALTIAKELDGDIRAITTEMIALQWQWMVVAVVKGEELLEAVAVITEVKRLRPPVTWRQGRETGRVPILAVAITTSPGGLSVRGAALLSQGRTIPTQLLTCLR